MTGSGEQADGTRETQIGAHSLRLEPPDLYLATFRGAVSGEEALAMARELDGFAQGKAYILGITDTIHIGSVSPSARRALLAFTPLIRGTAYLGVGPALQVVISIIGRAYRLVHRGADHPFAFFDTQNAARAWIAERRKTLELEAKQRAG